LFPLYGKALVSRIGSLTVREFSAGGHGEAEIRQGCSGGWQKMGHPGATVCERIAVMSTDTDGEPT